MIDREGRSVSRKRSDEEVRLPWWGTTRISAGESIGAIATSERASMSPGRRTLPPSTSIERTSDRSLSGARVGVADGWSTRTVAPPNRKISPRTRRRRARPLATP
jgi:hypothetical protein